jgi:hypothetical protein
VLVVESYTGGDVKVINGMQVSKNEQYKLDHELINNDLARRGSEIFATDMTVEKYIKKYGGELEGYEEAKSEFVNIMRLTYPEKYQIQYEAKILKQLDEVEEVLAGIKNSPDAKPKDILRMLEFTLKLIDAKKDVGQAMELVREVHSKDINEMRNLIRLCFDFMTNELLQMYVSQGGNEADFKAAVVNLYERHVVGKGFAKSLS